MVEEDAAKAGHDGLNIEGQVCIDSLGGRRGRKAGEGRQALRGTGLRRT